MREKEEENIKEEDLTDKIETKIKKRKEELKDYRKEKFSTEKEEDKLEEKRGIKSFLPFFLLAIAGLVLGTTVLNDLKTTKGGKMEGKTGGTTE